MNGTPRPTSSSATTVNTFCFASARDFKPTFGAEEFANVYLDIERIYLVTLAKDTEPPLGPRSDEVGKAEEKRAKDKRKGRRREKSRREKITVAIS